MTELEVLEKKNDMLVMKIENQLEDINNLIKEINNDIRRK